MAEAAKALAKAGSITLSGKSYQLKPFDYDGIAWFELQLEARAWDSVERTRHLVTAEVYERRLEVMAKLIAAGRFAFGSDAATEATKTSWGQKKLLYWMLASAPENADKDINEALVEKTFAEDMAMVLARLNEATADPNGTAPVVPGSH